VTVPKTMANEAMSGKAVGKATSRKPAMAETSTSMASAAWP
jgi:hypothetical protein